MGRIKTETSDFGVSKREGHDATRFYSSKLYEGFEINEKQKIIDNSSEILSESFNNKKLLSVEELKTFPKDSVHMILILLPDLTIENYEKFSDWLETLKEIFMTLKNLLITGGRLNIIVNNHVSEKISLSRYFPYHTFITKILLECNLIIRGNIILETPDKSISAKNKTFLNEVYSLAIISCKDLTKRIRKDKKKEFEKTDSITRDQFLSYTKSIWHYEPELQQNKSIIKSYGKEMSDYIQRFANLFSFIEDTIMYIFPEIDSDFEKLVVNIRKNNILFENYTKTMEGK